MKKFIIALSILLASCAKDNNPAPQAGPKQWTPIEGKYAIIIGDSISEGHPGLHGRLHPFHGASWGIDVDLNHQNESGQLAYELEHNLGIRFVNQGIGGQTAHMIYRGRWNQDVHPKSAENPDSTLPYDYAPSLIYIHVGINDIATSDNYDQMRDAIKGMIDDAASIGAQVIIDTVEITFSIITKRPNNFYISI